jgi:hypothetical protein
MSKIVARMRPKEEPRRRVDAVALRDALVLLSSGCKSAERREQAARQLLAQLRRLARARALAGLLSKPGYRACGDDLIEDAIQHTAIAACCGAARFRGSTPPAAVAWCLGILRNYARAEVRRRALRQSDTSFLEAPQLAGDTTRYEGLLWHAAAQETQVILGSLDSQLRAHLQRTRSQRAAKSLYQAVRSYVVEVTGAHERDSPPAPSAPANRNASPQRKARDRAYQHHHRARRILAEVRAAYESGVATDTRPPRGTVTRVEAHSKLGMTSGFSLARCGAECPIQHWPTSAAKGARRGSEA